MPKIDLSQVPVRNGSSYPAPHDAAMAGRSQQRLGDAGGLSQFGANLVRLAPGAMSSLRHWHEQQDEFAMVTEGTLVLVENEGETELTTGDFCAFPAGIPNGHHLVNRSEAEAAFLVIGTRTPAETGWYSDHDMKVEISDGEMVFSRRDGSALDTPPSEIQEAPSQDDRSLHEIFSGLSEGLSRGLIEDDFATYQSVFHLPCSVHPRSGKPYTIHSEDELRTDFDLYVTSLRTQNTENLTRELISLSQPEPDACVVETIVTLASQSGLIVEPFTTTYRLEQRHGDWRIARIISSLGHINWTLGKAGITDKLKFELD